MKKLFLLLIVSIILSACTNDESTNPDTEGSQSLEEEKATNKGDLHNEMELTKANLDNLYTLGKVWGFLKYYHPNVADGEFDFDQELMGILPEIMKAENADERDGVLIDWIVSLGDFEMETNPEETGGDIKMEPDLDWIIASNFNEKLVQQLQNVKDGKRNTYHHYVSLTDVGYPIFEEEAYADMSNPEVEYRLLSLYRYWNMIEYYFPYKYLIEEDWDDVLHAFLPKFINASTEKEYVVTVSEMIARIHDTHAQIVSDEPALHAFWGNNYAPLIMDFIEDKPVVTGYYHVDLGKETGLQVGDVITKVDDKPIEAILDEKLKYISASNHTIKLREMSSKILRTNDTSLEVEFIRDGKTKTREIKAGVEQYDPFQKDQDYYREFSEDIAYLYLGSIKAAYAEEIRSNLEGKQGLIVDLRCYPSAFITYALGEYLLPQSEVFAKVTSGNVITPGLFSEAEELHVGENNEDYFKGEVVLLVNEFTQSQAEFTAMALQNAPNATVIGSTTAATDGDISHITLPGGIETIITGIGIYYPDGTETQRIGIVPDVTVEPSIEGIKQGRDEVLERAIELINGEE
ncbi:S41 family peptidase [Aquibacillus koreensis]|uniref:S41 family peptidase n=1 Tax=Aquibacillus koreensis TaxID=279446 RepID=A0A9X3WLT1_9BACI|nr:S41 family peptidase [Aquibacillus koreensis]MCT2534746.1 S41 family peptidase [Aquibacillus koreensis]MDC3419644.1 S41 family peptidase [Aquibacillus koreensis]